MKGTFLLLGAMVFPSIALSQDFRADSMRTFEQINRERTHTFNESGSTGYSLRVIRPQSRRIPPGRIRVDPDTRYSLIIVNPLTGERSRGKFIYPNELKFKPYPPITLPDKPRYFRGKELE